MTRSEQIKQAAENTFLIEEETMSLDEQSDMILRQVGFKFGAKWADEHKMKQSHREKEYVRTLKSLIADFLRGKDEIDRSYYQDIYDWLEGRSIDQKAVQEVKEEIINELSDVMSYEKDCEELINDFWDKIEELKAEIEG